MKNKILFFLMMFIAFLLQTTVFKWLAVGGVSPNLLMIATSYMGFMKGNEKGMVTGFFSGLLVDIFFGPVLGVNALIYMIIGYLNGELEGSFYPDDIKLPIAFVAVSTFLYDLVSFGVHFLFRTRGFFTFLWRITLPEVVYTVFITLLIYRLMYRIDMKLSMDEKRG